MLCDLAILHAKHIKLKGLVMLPVSGRHLD
jgi:hypothetical protein